MNPTVGPETAQWVKVLIAESDDLSLILVTHKRTGSHKLSPDFNSCAMYGMCFPTPSIIEKLKIKETHCEERHHHVPEYPGLTEVHKDLTRPESAFLAYLEMWRNPVMRSLGRTPSVGSYRTALLPTPPPLAQTSSYLPECTA